ncbi:phosphoribosylanthranilate isomerase [Oceanobacillus senegalensis]|uniref:phosphoribosylanthranilate isomerase n=1 Tax=Oceanobacillus senegalensis TaxID=1936063 RepID=UPI000A304621|nr:phosphoribosylanthranilate isomerase [Oceanobacillus senegalensis]
MLVKICGIQNVETAEAAITSGADFIGFVFADSKRKITPEKAANIAKVIPSSVKKVGVFVNEEVDRIKAIAQHVGLDYIQLHGDESPSIAKDLPYKIIKAFSVDPNKLQDIQDYPCDYYLLDSPKGKYRGGNGKTFDWRLLEKVSLSSKKVILAGGLSTTNVEQAIQLTQPIGVDVSSGVETNGKKDQQKMMDFIKAAKKTRKDDSIGNIHHA